jgi:putative transposase
MRKQPQTYFVTTVTEGRRALLQSNQNADLMIDILFRYRDEGRYALHAFVVMPDHIHAVITPSENQSIERCMQCIKGGYSHSHPSTTSIWQRGFHEHRLRDPEDYVRHMTYIIQNPEKRGLRDHRHVHTTHVERLDPTPEHLKG